MPRNLLFSLGLRLLTVTPGLIYMSSDTCLSISNLLLLRGDLEFQNKWWEYSFPVI